jgi:hypothetical protein
MLFHLTEKSENAKTGPMPVTTSSKETCPPACPFRKSGCYAASGALNFHWLKVSNGSRGLNFKDFCQALSDLPPNVLGRLAQAGDMPGKGNRINGDMSVKLTQAVSGKRFYTYTHKPVLGRNYVAKQNRKHVKLANKNGLTINLSGNNLNHADKLKALNIGPVVTVLPIESPEMLFTPGGNKVIVCPAQSRDNVTCNSCGLCQKRDRSVIVGFRAHGNAKRAVAQIALT